mmetsp:Transcript_13355/g.46198  ORF Transcript_13355/g.46198 Transcript_13355/m.46198 type:complete len:331 (-) Transcript_13355:178-1170(-)
MVEAAQGGDGRGAPRLLQVRGKGVRHARLQDALRRRRPHRRPGPVVLPGLEQGAGDGAHRGWHAAVLPPRAHLQLGQGPARLAEVHLWRRGQRGPAAEHQPRDAAGQPARAQAPRRAHQARAEAAQGRGEEGRGEVPGVVWDVRVVPKGGRVHGHGPQGRPGGPPEVRLHRRGRRRHRLQPEGLRGPHEGGPGHHILPPGVQPRGGERIPVPGVPPGQGLRVPAGVCAGGRVRDGPPRSVRRQAAADRGARGGGGRHAGGRGGAERGGAGGAVRVDEGDAGRHEDQGGQGHQQAGGLAGRARQPRARGDEAVAHGGDAGGAGHEGREPAR